MMKKVLAVLLALALVFGLTACTGTPAETQGTQKETRNPLRQDRMRLTTVS